MTGKINSLEELNFLLHIIIGGMVGINLIASITQIKQRVNNLYTKLANRKEQEKLNKPTNSPIEIETIRHQEEGVLTEEEGEMTEEELDEEVIKNKTQRRRNNTVQIKEGIRVLSSEIIPLNPIIRPQNIIPQESLHNINPVPCATLAERVEEIEDQLVKITEIVLFKEDPGSQC